MSGGSSPKSSALDEDDLIAAVDKQANAKP